VQGHDHQEMRIQRSRVLSSFFFPLKVVADTSSLILLTKASLIIPFCENNNIYVPEVVFKESTSKSSYDGTILKRIFDSKKINLYLNPSNSLSYNKLSGGEKEVIELFYQIKADCILIDDKKGVSLCREFKIPHLNALLIPIFLLKWDIISLEKAHTAFNKLITIGRYSKKVIDIAKNEFANIKR